MILASRIRRMTAAPALSLALVTFAVAADRPAQNDRPSQSNSAARAGRHRSVGSGALMFLAAGNRNYEITIAGGAAMIDLRGGA
jgi:hypothetical protein